MRGMTETLTLGQRIRWYRRRRGIPQEVLAHRVGRKEDWLSKVENDRIPLDRLSVIKSLADALDITVGDLLAEPKLMDWTPDSGQRTVPAIREMLMDYRQLTPLLGATAVDDPASLEELGDALDEVMTDYQASRYSTVVRRLPFLLADAIAASNSYSGDDRPRAQAVLALSYQAVAAILPKLGEQDLAWIAADRGLAAARQADDIVIVGSLFRSVIHTLSSTGRYAAAVQLTQDAGHYLEPAMSKATPALHSIYGMLFLAGSMAAARSGDRTMTSAFLREADEAAVRLGSDANHMWTAFGPTNVAIHRVATSNELGEPQVALALAPRIDTSQLPIERRVRHDLEVARSYNLWNRQDDALSTVLTAEQLAAEQVRYHFLSRQLVQDWISRRKSRPTRQLIALAQRMRIA